MKPYQEMDKHDLAEAFLNWLRRAMIVSELKCSSAKVPGYDSWYCCVPHQGINNEKAHMDKVAQRIHTSTEASLLSPNWWREIGMDDTAAKAKEICPSPYYPL